MITLKFCYTFIIASPHFKAEIFHKRAMAGVDNNNLQSH